MRSIIMQLAERALPGSLGTPGQRAAWIICPVTMFLAFRLFGESGLITAALSIPVLTMFGDRLLSRRAPHGGIRIGGRELKRKSVEEILDEALATRAVTGRPVACAVMQLDAFEATISRLGHRGADLVLEKLHTRLAEGLRDSDAIGRLDGATFVIALTPSGGLDLEALLSICARLQELIAQPVMIDATSLKITASIGFSQADRVSPASGSRMIVAAEAALGDARSSGSGSIRAYTAELHRRHLTRTELALEVHDALANGAIRPWFQPQVSTDTGHVTGFEALARWSHPTRGMIPPVEFLDAIEQAGQLDRLGQVILNHSLTALRAWDRAGFKVPSVGVNYSLEELRDPQMADRIKWELDRFDVAPVRLTVEVLETVVANAPDDIVCRNIAALSEYGCEIDLDDFGTGHSSITSIRRFAVNRLKIDRSFVTGADQDPEQQRLITAILSMAERLNLETLAEGVETVGEHAILSQLGCGHVQGYGIARPMPFEDTPAWLDRHNAKLARTPTLRSGTT